MKEYLAKHLNMHTSQSSFMVKRHNEYSCLSNEFFEFLDMTHCLAHSMSKKVKHFSIRMVRFCGRARGYRIIPIGSRLTLYRHTEACVRSELRRSSESMGRSLHDNLWCDFGVKSNWFLTSRSHRNNKRYTRQKRRYMGQGDTTNKTRCTMHGTRYKIYITIKSFLCCGHALSHFNRCGGYCYAISRGSILPDNDHSLSRGYLSLIFNRVE